MLFEPDTLVREVHHLFIYTWYDYITYYGFDENKEAIYPTMAQYPACLKGLGNEAIWTSTLKIISYYQRLVPSSGLVLVQEVISPYLKVTNEQKSNTTSSM